MKTGFTLIEVLISLLVLTITATVALESQLMAVRLEHIGRITSSVQFEIERIITETILGHAITNGTEAVTKDCEIRKSIIQVKENDISTDWIQWEIIPRARPCLKTVILTHLPEPSSGSISLQR